MAFRAKLNEFIRGMLLLYSLLVAFGAVVFLLPIFTMAWFDTRYSITFASAFDMSLILAAGMLLHWIMLKKTLPKKRMS